jgi:hypothetical protein
MPRITALIASIILMFALAANPAWAQFRSTINGVVLDPNNAAVPNAEIVVTHVETGAVSKAASAGDGNYALPNLVTGTYDLRATAAGFKPFVQRGITLTLNQIVKVDIQLEVGTLEQTVEVTANASPLNFENSTRQEGVAPETINELPLIVSGSPRNAAQFAVLLPGVSTGSSNNAFDARINGGIQSGDEAIMDGVSMQQGTMSQTGMISFWDFRMTPDMISEFKVLTSNYEPQYGTTTSANIMVTTKSGGNEFHGALYEYLRNTSLNARQFGADKRPKDIEHDFGGAIGGPVKLPGLWSNKFKTYFYTNIEKFYIRGGVNRPTLSIPTEQQRRGDFSDWRDGDGKLIPIYDPATTRIVDGQVVRNQFMGCDGTQPNVICPSRIANSLANEWFQYLPNTNRPGTLNNYLVPTPVPDTILGDALHWLVKIDEYVGDKDHFAGTIWRQKTPAKFATTLPIQIASENLSDPQDSWVERLNWDHTFSPTVLNHFAAGYLNRNEGYGVLNAEMVNELPRIPGVANNQNYPPVIRFDDDDFAGFGASDGINTGNITTRPAYVFNDMVTWVKGKHTWKFGGEYRNIGQNFHTNGNESGNFHFDRGATSIRGVNSGSPIASFLLEQVATADSSFRTVSAWYARADAFTWHAGDTWRATTKLSINYGIRWDMHRPTVEKFDRLSFFDPVGANPAAGNRPGRLVFAGNEYGAASFGKRRPEETWKRGYGPRLGIAYAFDDRTVVRTGYGIFYTQNFYPNWGGGMNLDGFNADVSFGSTQDGLVPAFILREGFPQNFQRPPFIDAGFRNGRGTMYRPFESGILSNSQQWNLTVERQLGKDILLSAGYVGNKGSHLPSYLEPINALHPNLLSMGEKLNAEFEPGQASLHGVSVPYAGWTEQLLDAGCSPTVAQALLPYPQYCSGLYGLNEKIGNSTYHSFQAKVEKRFSEGTYLLASYTLQKLITDVGGHVDPEALTWNNVSGVISPFERSRNRALAHDDVPQILNVTFVYELPFGRGKRFGGSSRAIDLIGGGWRIASVTRFSSGVPLYFRSNTYCNVPGQFRVGCIPGIMPGRSPFAVDKGGFDPGSGQSLFDKSSFEPESAFDYYYGVGSRITNYRTYGFKNEDLAVYKDFRINERMKFQLRGEFFNLFNWHNFVAGSQSWGAQAFNTDISSPDFGIWNGSVSSPRNIQVGARFEF